MQPNKKRMPLSHALVVSATIVAASILGSKLIAPYQVSTAGIIGGYTFVWRVNTITGTVRLCKPASRASQIAAAKAAGYSEAQIAAYLEDKPSVYTCE